MKTVLFAGSMQSGKTTSATAIYAYALTQKGAIPNAQIDSTGRMSILFDKENNEGIYFDIDDQSPEFLEYKDQHTSQYVNHVGFADELKIIASTLFGLDYNKIIGSNDEKNENSPIKWADMNATLPANKRKKNAPEFMTNREFLEVFGTDICRSIYTNCLVQSAHKKLLALNPEIGIIPDCRFTNEFEFFEKNDNTFKIKLNRNPYKSDAKSENGLAEIDDSRFDLVVPEDLSLEDKNNMVINFLLDVGVLSSQNIEVGK